MARINSILAIVVDQNANELRLASDREPKMLAWGTQKKLSIPAMPTEMIRELLGEIVSREVELRMAESGRAEITYDAGALGMFEVTLTSQEGGGLGAAFLRSSARAPVASLSTTQVSHPSPIAASQGAHSPSSRSIAAVPSRIDPPEIGAANESLAALVSLASAMNATDIHVLEGESPFVRIDGTLRRLDNEPAVSISSLLGVDDATREIIEKNRSIDRGLDVGDRRIRVHAYTTAGGLAAAIRLLPAAAPTLSSLSMPAPLDDLVTFPHGLVLLCGATGSGKSTTLAALAQEALRRKSIVLVTLEDPIEYALHPTSTSIVRRRQVGRDITSFASGLRDALREDPDVLLVGEMRDPETIALALTAAETGHLVLASIHSRSAASAVERIIDSYPPERQTQIRAQLADSLRAVVGQRLVKRAKGAGRLPAIEILRVTHAVGSLIREGKTAQLHSTIQSSRREGMLTLERSLADRVQNGEIRLEDARAVANEPDSLASYLG